MASPIRVEDQSRRWSLPEELVLMRCIDELHLNYPFAGARMLAKLLKHAGQPVGRPHTDETYEHPPEAQHE